MNKVEKPVHPRLRGELPSGELFHTTINGSSPLTRGTRLWTTFSWILFSVHPRLRGELIVAKLFSREKVGSSPLTRGTLLFIPLGGFFSRFIPAYAGNSARRLRRRTLRPVHPRLRGELQPSPKIMLDIFGSSPLTRGTLQRATHRK